MGEPPTRPNMDKNFENDEPTGTPNNQNTSNGENSTGLPLPNSRYMKEFLHFFVGIALLYHSQKAVATIDKNLLFGMIILWFNSIKR